MTAKTAKPALPEAETPEDVNTQKNKNTHTTETPEQPVEAPIGVKPFNAYQRMILAQKVIDGMPWVKDLTNAQFKSIPIDAMRNGVRKACIQAGLVCVGPLDLRYDVQSRDGRIKVYTGTCTFRYVNADNPFDWIDYPTLGEAMDTGDKGAGKLLSNLAKSHYKTCFFIGEQGKDDIDSYTNEEIEAEAERIAARRAKAVEKASQDPFFGDALAPLRREVGRMMADESARPVVERYKAEHGQLPQWPREVLEQCVADCKAAKEGGA